MMMYLKFVQNPSNCICIEVFVVENSLKLAQIIIAALQQSMIEFQKCMMFYASCDFGRFIMELIWGKYNFSGCCKALKWRDFLFLS